MEGGKKGGREEGRLESKAWHHMSLLRILADCSLYVTRDGGQRQAWDMDEGEFHNPCSHLPCPDCLAPMKTAPGLPRGAREPAGLALALL